MPNCSDILFTEKRQSRAVLVLREDEFKAITAVQLPVKIFTVVADCYFSCFCIHLFINILFIYIETLFCLENITVIRKTSQYIEVGLPTACTEVHSFSCFGIICVEMYDSLSAQNTAFPRSTAWYLRSIMTTMNQNWRGMINPLVLDSPLDSVPGFFNSTIAYII